MENPNPNIKSNPNIKDLKNNINEYFQNISFNEQYNYDIWFTVVSILIVLVITIYFYVISNLSKYRADWENNKCNPLFIPFASLINPQTGEDAIVYTIKNFNSCMNDLTEELAEDAVKPLNFMQEMMKGFFKMGSEMFVVIQNFIMYLINLILELYKLIGDKIQMFLTEFKMLFVNVNDLLGKILGIFSVIYYTIILLISSFKLIFVVFTMGILITMLIPLAASMTGTWTTFGTIMNSVGALMFWLPWSFPGIIGLLVVASVFLTAAIIFTIFFKIVSMIYEVLAEFAGSVLGTPIE
jgi:hypothetical protein